MSDVNKSQGRICPKCGEAYSKYEFAKVSLGPGVQANLCCENNHRWSEFYSLAYQGYWWDGNLYDSYGAKIPTTGGEKTNEDKV